MVTNPNTLGFFEENITEIAEIVHARGGLVYADGANMNAMLGIVNMGGLGIDLLHLNLHKTFSTPHGGGGPGAGPICVKKHLEPYLPVPRIMESNGKHSLSWDFPSSMGKLHAFYGNTGIMIRAYSYILSLGPELKKVSQLAVLNANYIKEKLKGILHLPYDRPCMHECVFSDRLQAPLKITTLDMVKRLIDYGFHPPTIYFPLVVCPLANLGASCISNPKPCPVEWVKYRASFRWRSTRRAAPSTSPAVAPGRTAEMAACCASSTAIQPSLPPTDV